LAKELSLGFKLLEAASAGWCLATTNPEEFSEGAFDDVMTGLLARGFFMNLKLLVDPALFKLLTESSYWF